MAATPNFIAGERLAQSDFYARRHPHAAGLDGAAYRLLREHAALNLAPTIREAAQDYFGRLHQIAWHQHANHGLSSQVCCLNFLMPLATRPDLLSRLVGRALGIEPPEMLPVEEGGLDACWFVGFEWIGAADYLNEAPTSGRRTRGANATSADAVVRFRHAGRIESLLIEWKYTESYGAPIPPNGNATRMKRYSALAFAPDGPIRSDLGLKLEDFFWEPFYQLLRQQMLAMRMQAAGEGQAERVRVLHISPSANRALRKVTAPALRKFGDDAFAAFGGVLARPDDFISVTIEQLFGPLVADLPGDPWASYLTDRYQFLTPAAVAADDREF